MPESSGAHLSRRSFLQSALGAGLAVGGLPDGLSRAATNAVRVAGIVDLTGAGSVYGVPVRNGMVLAVNEINRGGGINGHPFDLRVADGKSDLMRIGALVQQAGRDASTVAMAGPTLSSEAVQADPLAQEAGLPVLAVSNTVPGLTAIGKYIFRLPLGDDRIIPVVLNSAHRHYHFKRAAVVYDNVNAATAAAGRVFLASAPRIGLNVVATETFASGADHLTAQLAAVKASNPDVIFVSALAGDAVALLTQRIVAGIPPSTPIIGANGLNTPAIIRGAGAAAEGVIVGTTYDPNDTGTRNRQFRAAFSRNYHHAPDVFAAQGYDGIHALARALRHAHTTRDRRALRAALAGLKGVPTVLSATGRFSFTAQREANLTPIVRVVRHGRFVRFS